jgi:hypothetical protein
VGPNDDIRDAQKIYAKILEKEGSGNYGRKGN